MYKFTYFDEQVKSIFSDRSAFWDTDLEQELSPVLETLKKCGEVAGASCGVKPGVSGLVYELRGRTFQITYTVDVFRKEIRFYEFQQISHSIDWKTALEQDLRVGENQSVYIPQIGDPHKFIKAVELIHYGINTPKDLGIAFRSGAKKDRDLARRGDYLGRPIIEIGLASRCQNEKQPSSIYILTERGKRIAESNDLETRERLLAEALLGLYPIQMIIEETTRGNKELTKELIQEIISLVSLGDCGGTTNPRRASSLRALVNWVTRWAGIPIRREGNDGVQLYIPYIYAN
ncbi:hypothetical protein [Leptolyngbya sp. FACHB-261]|uniref:DUF7226 domain-containing protein n=1 Tax=Leptolyngbya sp. FACHB-261 TaxID=2692806 RepID=UPI0016849B03|nr:hypothetical protein [Leptolyngbya sp. FACHB-261]MBD2100169.1 hypothetical protein [Leptolyngbya sp. FACHB-261]